ncbi:MAG: hypothetical protein ACRES3_04200 [Steroidobacteraceae bacterium]
MAVTDRDETQALAPNIGSMLRHAAVPWLAPLRSRLAAMQDQGRLPHGMLLTGPPGAGQAEIGVWIAACLLCRRRAADACGRCADCRLFLAGTHPDFFWIGVEPDKKDINIEQMRVLAETLSLRSYRGGAKIALIWPAEAMNIKSFNALLKTLEEPSDDTFLLLATRRSDRIPRTIASRCMRLRLPSPAPAEATDWLAHVMPPGDWQALLELANGAPFLAEEYAALGLGELDGEMQAAISSAKDGRLDFVGLAESWAKKAPDARLFWLESWLTRSLKEAGLASDLVNDNRLPWLRPPGVETKIRAGYRLLDQLRDARRLISGALNTQLLFEGLLVSLAALLGKPPGKVQE